MPTVSYSAGRLTTGYEPLTISTPSSPSSSGVVERLRELAAPAAVTTEIPGLYAQAFIWRRPARLTTELAALRGLRLGAADHGACPASIARR